MKVIILDPMKMTLENMNENIRNLIMLSSLASSLKSFMRSPILEVGSKI